MYDQHAMRTVCYQDIDPTEWPIYVEPSPESASLPKATFQFVLTNETDSMFSTGPHAWRVHKIVEGEWYFIGPTRSNPLGWELDPGNPFTWSANVDNSNVEQPIEHLIGGMAENIPLPGLGAGTYAFGISGHFEETSYKHQTAFATQFELTGDPLTITPTNTFRETKRSGDTLMITENYPPEYDEASWKKYEVTRLDTPPEDEPLRRLIPEQLIRDTFLRNAIVHFQKETDLRVVRVITKLLPYYITSHFEITDPTRDLDVIEYDGTIYRVERGKPQETPQPPE